MTRAKHAITPFLLSLLAVTGCTWTSPQEQLGWKANEYFDDPEVIALCHAIESSDLKAVRAAFDSGADINLIGKDGMTPLMWAFPNQRIDCFSYLLERGADPNICLTDSVGAMFPKGRSVTYMAIAARQSDYYPLVLKHGGDPNLFCAGQREPLICVPIAKLVSKTNERIEALLDAGADIDVKSSSDTTLVMGAVAVARFQLAVMLLERGADVDPYQERHNRQLVHFVIDKERSLSRYSKGNREAYRQIVELLVEKGVDFDKARADIERWKKAWGGKTLEEKARLRKLEHDRRRALEAEEQQPELAEPARD